MKKKFSEGLILFYSILKWFVLATVIGVVVGSSTTFFLKLLNSGINHTSKFPEYFLLLPLVFFLTILIVKYLAPDAEGHGTEKVIEAIHKRNGRIKPLVVPIKFLATIVSISSGASAGKEGPCAQIGAGLSSIIADLFRFNEHDRKKLAICGISAGFASVFGTPIAGAIFGVEVLVVGNILYDVLLPSFIAGMTAFQISSAFGIKYFYLPLNFTHKFSEMFLVNILLAGIFFGLCSFLMIEILNFVKFLSAKLKIWEPFKGLVGGLILVVLVYVFSTQYLGLGLSTIEDSLNGYNIIWYAFIVKIIFTAITLNFGGSGGVITPILFVGATSGTLFANLFHLDKSTFSAIGMVSLLAGATNAPIAASIMSVELFGSDVAPYAAIACVICFIMTGHRSVYPSQMLGFRKSVYINAELGSEIDKANSQNRPEGEKFLKLIFKVLSYLNARIKKSF